MLARHGTVGVEARSGHGRFEALKVHHSLRKACRVSTTIEKSKIDYMLTCQILI
jgi:hypothetical protein